MNEYILELRTAAGQSMRMIVCADSVELPYPDVVSINGAGLRLPGGTFQILDEHPRRAYILTDGNEIMGRQDMTQDEWRRANQTAKQATDGTMRWMAVEDQHGYL